MAATFVGLAVAGLYAGGLYAAGSALSEEPIPMATEEELPERTAPPVEIGPHFLGTGNLPQGIELPTGAVWNPAFWVYGDFRTALNYYDDGVNDPIGEWANRLDLYGNLHLSGTERLLIGISPLNDDGTFSGYTFEPDRDEGTINETNSDITRFFFEGELVEIFPRLDPGDRGLFDIGFAIGRQPLLFQEGIMINDSEVDGVGITRDTIIIPGLSVDTRATLFFGWNGVNRDNNVEDDEAELLGLFVEGDWGASTVQIDAAYVDSENAAGVDRDSFHFGVGSTQRVALFGRTVNTAVRLNTSEALDRETPAASDGTLLFGEFNIIPHGTNDVVYLNAFWGEDRYSSALRDETAGGPLGQTGILFAAVGLGRYGAALSNQADNVAGASIGRQFFWDGERKQVILEAGGRAGTEDGTQDQAAVGARYQQALGRRFVFRLDGFVSTQEEADDGAGLRTELQVRF
ncbi:hypothetical protein [Halofilum ochraceum]|uniref:hypothetical protein n=1 Tax=Halofilum ochraceum TaxID=1611323 RepID=UPI0008DAF786|nr:hypothetical protein [Halofilum ochraceum]